MTHTSSCFSLLPQDSMSETTAECQSPQSEMDSPAACTADADQQLARALLMELYYDKIRLLKRCLAARGVPTEETDAPAADQVAPVSTTLPSPSPASYPVDSRDEWRMARPPPPLPLQESASRVASMAWMHTRSAEVCARPISVLRVSLSPTTSPDSVREVTSRRPSKAMSWEHASAHDVDRSPSESTARGEGGDSDVIRARCRRTKWPKAPLSSSAAAPPPPPAVSRRTHTAARSPPPPNSRRLTALSLPSSSLVPHHHNLPSASSTAREPPRRTGTTATSRCLLSPFCEDAPTPSSPGQSTPKATATVSVSVRRVSAVVPPEKNSTITPAMVACLSRRYRSARTASAVASTASTSASASAVSHRMRGTARATAMSGARDVDVSTGGAPRQRPSSYTLVSVSAPPARPRRQCDLETTGTMGPMTSTELCTPHHTHDAQTDRTDLPEVAQDVEDVEDEDHAPVSISSASSSSVRSSPSSHTPSQTLALTGGTDRGHTQPPLSTRSLNVIHVHSKPGTGGLDMRDLIAHTNKKTL